MTDSQHTNNGLRFPRLIMVLSSVSPLFALWAIRGTKLFPDSIFVSLCILFILVPNLYIFIRLSSAKRNDERRDIVVGRAEDHRDHLLVYLFTMLIPFYSTNLADWREFVATLVAVGFIIFLFWNMNLHYMNILFAAKGFRIFTVYPPAQQTSSRFTGTEPFVLITRRAALSPNEKLTPYRLSDSVYWEDN